MATYPLHLQGGHLFVEINQQRWLFDTGTAISYGSTPSLTVAERTFALKPIMTSKPGKPIIGVFRPSQLNMTQVELAARGVCHKGNPLTAPNSSTFYSDSGRR